MSVVILNFHGVGVAPPELSDFERSFWIEQRKFESILDLIGERSQVQITFDDGNASDAAPVLPALSQRGMRATFFVCSGRLDQPGFLSGADISRLQSCGMSIGSHGVAHISWRGLPPDRLAHELAESRQALEAICGNQVNSAACPFGAYDRAVLRALREAGYRSVYTSDGGVAAENCWLKPRTTITRLMTLHDIERLLLRQGFGLLRQSLLCARMFIKSCR